MPHLGDWMQDGQPASHSQEAMASRVAASQARAVWKARSAKPAPPGWPSYTKTVGRRVSGCSGTDTPPMSQRSQVAKSGSMPMEACSAACREPPRISGVIRASSSWSSVTVHHTARVRSVRGGRSSLVSPSTSPVIRRLRRKETTWLVTSTEP